MSTKQKHGAPVRVERSDPDLIAEVAKIRAVAPEGVKVVSRLEGLLINEEAARKAAVAASERLLVARKIYTEAEAAYTAAVAARKEEERNAVEDRTGHGDD